MAERRAGTANPILRIDNLHVYYGHAHVLQGISLTLDHGVLSVVGRNGMGKTTLCNTIMGLVPSRGGSIAVGGQDITGRASNEIVAQGVGYVPQGRRVWPSLTVDEHLQLAARDARKRGGDWTVERIYEVFPRLAERRGNGGAQLSGGEQQMLAIGRALLGNPRLLVMDEPTEGLAPVIVDQVAGMLHELANEGSISVLLVEQNLGVATDVSDDIAVMVNGRISRRMAADALRRDHDLQQRLLGVRAAADGDEDAASGATPATAAPATETVQVFTVRRTDENGQPLPPPAEGYTATDLPNRWGSATTPEPVTRPDPAQRLAPTARDGHPEPTVEPQARPGFAEVTPNDPSGGLGAPRVEPVSIARTAGRAAYVVGTFDTKGRELGFLKTCIERLGLRVVTVDLSTTERPSPASVSPREVARHHPKGAGAVFTGDRGTAVTAMAQAFEHFIVTRRDLGGVISAGGSGGTSLATPAMRALPVGVPKVMVSTVASGETRQYVGPSDITMMYSVTDVQGLNRISDRVLSNAAHALAGMIAWRRDEPADAKPAVAMTMFGVTTPCVQMVQQALQDEYDTLVFHATGTGGQSMEKLAASGLLAGVLDITTTEVCDHFMGGVFSAGEARFEAIIESRLPYVVSCGALDMVNFGPRDTVPERYAGRTFYQHNPTVTLMRTTPEENARMGRWIGEKLNRMEGPVRLLIPEGGVSLLDAPGAAFWDPAADTALFRALEETVRTGPNRKLIKLKHNINDPAFAAALVEHYRKIAAPDQRSSNASIFTRRAS